MLVGRLCLTSWIAIRKTEALEKCFFGEASSRCLKFGPSAYINYNYYLWLGHRSFYLPRGPSLPGLCPLWKIWVGGSLQSVIKVRRGKYLYSEIFGWLEGSSLPCRRFPALLWDTTTNKGDAKRLLILTTLSMHSIYLYSGSSFKTWGVLALELSIGGRKVSLLNLK